MSDYLFRGVCAVLGELSEDNRMIAADADLQFDFTFPIPLLSAQFQEPGDSKIVGRVANAKVEDGLVFFNGEFLGEEPTEVTRELLERAKPSLALTQVDVDFDWDPSTNQMVTSGGKMTHIFLSERPLWPDKVWIEVYQRDEER